MKQSLKRILTTLYEKIGNPYSFLVILVLIIAWFIVGFFMHYDEHWYRAMEAFVILITLLMVFIIESTQHAEMKALQEKLDELIKKSPHTDDRKMRIEKKYKGEK